MTRFSLAVFCAALALACAPVASQARQGTASPSPSPAGSAAPSASPSPTASPGPPFSRMSWRELGPATAGGRIASVAGSVSNPNLYYVGTAGGGVWKSENGAQTWSPVFEKQKVAAIGAVVIDQQNNDVVWVGSGESNPRNDVSYGDGVYKTTDGGKTWTNVGLGNTRHIARILIDPRNSNHVIVGALGDVFKDSEDRGVYVTDDGGKTWNKTLYAGPQSGVSDLAMDVTHPNVVYAGVWQFRREPWTFHSGGDADGLYKSTDGGKTWNKLAGHGLPAGITGRIGLAVAPSNGNRVYAIIESSDGILWRSDNGGNDWTMVSNDTLVDQRPFYFTHIAVDPKNPDHVYAVSEMLAESKDAGKTFSEIAGAVHVDYHAIWIAQDNPDRIMTGEDGGYALTVDGGDHWFFSMNLPIGQVYHVGLSNETPYTICAGLQDNSGWCGPSDSLDPSGIMNKYWIQSTGGDGEWGVPDPSDPNFIWSDAENGSLSVYNKLSKDGWSAQPYLQNGNEQYDLSTSKYRFNWDSPIAFAPWNPHVAWYGANVVFQSTDRGISWKPISPDLTLNLKEHQQPSGGPITHDVSGAEYSDTILDIEGSPLGGGTCTSTTHATAAANCGGEIWVGTDDGLVQLTRDAGKHWQNVTPPGVPPFGRVETIAPSTISDGTAYVNIDRHRSGDYAPYVFVTHDFGKTWSSISAGLPADQYVRTIRPDIHTPGLLYLGNEEGIWISFDDGKTWQDFKNNLPTVSVRDIRLQPQYDDLVIATHGRSVYVMDDIHAIQGLAQAMEQGTMFFTPRVAYEYNLHSDDEGTYTDYAANNPPTGAMITFYQKAAAKDPPSLQIIDATGKVIRNIQGTHKVGGKDVPYITNNVGINRYVWDFGTDGPVKWTGAARERYQGPNEGPGVPPGDYTVRLWIGGKSYEQRVSVKLDPRSKFTQAQLVAAYQFSQKYFHEYSTVDMMLNALDTAKKQLNDANDQAKKSNNTALMDQIAAALKARDTVFHELTADYHNDEDSIQRPGALREDLGGAFTGLVTPPVVEYATRIDTAYQKAVGDYNGFVGSLSSVNTALQSAGLKALTGVSTVQPGI